MERHIKYLNALTAFAQAASEYSFAANVTKDKDAMKPLVKDLKKKAAILLVEYEAIPESSKVPELLEKIDKALAL